MKQFLLISLLTILCISYINSDENVCDEIYKCYDFTDNTCKQINENETVTFYYVQKCNSSSYCDITGTSPHTCKPYPSLPKKHGESCKMNTECYGVCNSKTNKCAPVENGETCSSHYSCKPVSYCDKEDSKCLPLRNAGDDCVNNEECPLGFLCSGTQDERKICIQMYSIETGDYAEEDELCKSGRTNGEYACLDTISKNGGMECNVDEDCPCEYDIKTMKENGTGECECNLEGRKYCEYGSNSKEWKKFVEVFNKKIKDTDKKNFYTAALREEGEIESEDELKYEFWQIKEIQNAYRDFDVRYKGVDKCIIDYLKNTKSYMKISIMLLSVAIAFII